MSRGTHEDSGWGPEIAFGISAILLVLGTVGVLLTSSNHSTCSSLLVQAINQNQCRVVSIVWSFGVIMLVAGLVLILAGAVMRRGAGR